jgi:hypothetical protein
VDVSLAKMWVWLPIWTGRDMHLAKNRNISIQRKAPLKGEAVQQISQLHGVPAMPIVNAVGDNDVPRRSGKAFKHRSDWEFAEIQVRQGGSQESLCLACRHLFRTRKRYRT